MEEKSLISSPGKNWPTSGKNWPTFFRPGRNWPTSF